METRYQRTSRHFDGKALKNECTGDLLAQLKTIVCNPFNFSEREI